MSDPVAEAAAALAQHDAAPSSTEPVVLQPGESATVTLTGPDAGEVTKEDVAESPNAAATLPAGAATPASTGNVLLNAGPVVEAPVVEVGSAEMGESSPSSVATAPAVMSSPTPSVDASADLPRESHLMLLEHKLAGMRAKLVNAERVTLDEFEQILGHIRAVL